MSAQFDVEIGLRPYRIGRDGRGWFARCVLPDGSTGVELVHSLGSYDAVVRSVPSVVRALLSDAPVYEDSLHEDGVSSMEESDSFVVDVCWRWDRVVTARIERDGESRSVVGFVTTDGLAVDSGEEGFEGEAMLQIVADCPSSWIDGADLADRLGDMMVGMTLSKRFLFDVRFSDSE